METVKNRVVIKVGTSTITTETGENNFRTMDKLAQVLSGLANEGYEVILVSSGAIAVGANKMGLQQKPKELKFINISNDANSKVENISNNSESNA